MAKISSEVIHEKSDMESDSAVPLFDRFYANGGSKTLLQMTNFNCCEFDRLCHCCHTVLSKEFTLGRGKKLLLHQKTEDILFIVLCVVKAATNWDLMCEIFEKKDPHFRDFFLGLSISWAPSSIKIVFSITLQNCQWQLSSKRKHNSKFFLCSLFHWSHFSAGNLSLRKYARGKSVLQWEAQALWFQNWSVCDTIRKGSWCHRP